VTPISPTVWYLLPYLFSLACVGIFYVHILDCVAFVITETAPKAQCTAENWITEQNDPVRCALGLTQRLIFSRCEYCQLSHSQECLELAIMIQSFQGAHSSPPAHYDWLSHNRSLRRPFHYNDSIIGETVGLHVMYYLVHS